MEGEFGVKRVGVEVHAPAVQLLGLALCALQGLGVEAVPLQLLVGVIVGSAGQRHSLLLQGILRGLDMHSESFRDGCEGTKVTSSLLPQTFKQQATSRCTVQIQPCQRTGHVEVDQPLVSASLVFRRTLVHDGNGDIANGKPAHPLWDGRGRTRR